MALTAAPRGASLPAMMQASRDTIFALSSGRPPAAIAVVRISGPRAGEALKALIGRLPDAREAALARVRDTNGETIDEALALWFPGPNSETGEDTAELQLHGGQAVIADTLSALGKIEGLRPAEAGEFTRRAFENGKLDLTAVEALADLIAAETSAQRRQAYGQLRGLLRDHADAWRSKLIEALALVDAGIDFADEADVPKNLIAPALAIAQDLHDEIGQALAQSRRGERLREGMVVAIAGPPNAGKSTLLNRIARRDAAIVSPFAGTTRDVIEVHLDLDGYPVTLIDTAGIRESDDPIEQEGMRRARGRAGSADLILWIRDSTSADETMNYGSIKERPVGQWPSQRAEFPIIWLIQNKIDLARLKVERTNKNERQFNNNEQQFAKIFDISAKIGSGLGVLEKALAEQAAQVLGGAEPALLTRERHRRLLARTKESLSRALAEGPGGREDLIAEELRFAANELGRLTGRVDVEDILDVIFRDFCIGK